MAGFKYIISTDQPGNHNCMGFDRYYTLEKVAFGIGYNSYKKTGFWRTKSSTNC